MILGDRAFVLLHDLARLHAVLFCFACPEIMVIEDLFFLKGNQRKGWECGIARAGGVWTT